MTATLSPITGAEAEHLLRFSDQYMESLYPAGSNHLVCSESLRQCDANFIGAFLSGDAMITSHVTAVDCIGAKRVAACIGSASAGFYRDEDHAEIKRLFIAEAHRGCGLARQLMVAIERDIVAENLVIARTQPEADSLHRSVAYREILPFGDYLLDSLSQFLEKHPPVLHG